MGGELYHLRIDLTFSEEFDIFPDKAPVMSFEMFAISIINLVSGAAIKLSSNTTPRDFRAAKLTFYHVLNDDHVFLGRPRQSVDIRVKGVNPVLAALLSESTRKFTGALGPFSCTVILYMLNNDVFFFLGPSTIDLLRSTCCKLDVPVVAFEHGLLDDGADISPDLFLAFSTLQAGVLE